MSDLARQQCADCDADFELGWLELVWPSNLAAGLACAGALCAAWYQGSRHALGARAGIDGFDWAPGCGRAALGWQGGAR